jgi:hypothetical protein
MPTEGEGFIMDPGEFDMSKLLDYIRKSASIKAGAIMFGEAQIAYYDVLKEHLGEEAAYNMTANTSEILIRTIGATVGTLAEAAVRLAAIYELVTPKPGTDKEVPGEK